jgi:hypothetical protein
VSLTYEQLRAFDLRMYGVHYAEITYRLENGEPVENGRERVHPRHIGKDGDRLFLRMDSGTRVYFDEHPLKFVAEQP